MGGGLLSINWEGYFENIFVIWTKFELYFESLNLPGREELSGILQGWEPAKKTPRLAKHP